MVYMDNRLMNRMEFARLQKTIRRLFKNIMKMQFDKPIHFPSLSCAKPTEPFLSADDFPPF